MHVLACAHVVHVHVAVSTAEEVGLYWATRRVRGRVPVPWRAVVSPCQVELYVRHSFLL